MSGKEITSTGIASGTHGLGEADYDLPKTMMFGNRDSMRMNVWLGAREVEACLASEIPAHDQAFRPIK